MNIEAPNQVNQHPGSESAHLEHRRSNRRQGNRQILPYCDIVEANNGYVFARPRTVVPDRPHHADCREIVDGEYGSGIRMACQDCAGGLVATGNVSPRMDDGAVLDIHSALKILLHETVGSFCAGADETKTGDNAHPLMPKLKEVLGSKRSPFDVIGGDRRMPTKSSVYQHIWKLTPLERLDKFVTIKPSVPQNDAFDSSRQEFVQLASAKFNIIQSV